jgi:hypothetical protein
LKLTKPFAVLCVVLTVVGCKDQRVADLEKRVSALEDAAQQIQSDRDKSASDDAARRLKLEECVAGAEADFQRDVANNGSKARNDSYDIPVPALAEMQKRKQGKLQECALLYSK